MKPTAANPAELEILAAAHEYVAKCHRAEAGPFATVAAAQAAGEALAAQMNRGATVYARAVLHETPCGALHSSYRPGKGWALNQ